AAGSAVADVNDEISAIVADGAVDAPFWLLGPVGDQDILALRLTQAVIIQFLVEGQALELRAFPGLGITAVETALVVMSPGNIAEFDETECVAQDFAARHVHDLPGVPVRAGIRNAVGQVRAVLAEVQAAQGNRAVLGPLVRIEQNLWLRL